MIRTVLFDMGNVLIRFEPETFMTRVGVTDPADRALLLREVYRSVEWVQMDGGTLTEKEACDIYRTRLPERLWEAMEKLVAHWDRPLLTVDGMADLVRELHENGYGLFLLTNATFRQREYWPRFPYIDYFPPEKVFLSAEEHLLKPELAFFEGALRRFSLQAEECAFIDDYPANVEASLRAGIHGILFHGDAAETRRKLRDLGVKVSG